LPAGEKFRAEVVTLTGAIGEKSGLQMKEIENVERVR
jgi:hypothetical protein